MESIRMSVYHKGKRFYLMQSENPFGRSLAECEYVGSYDVRVEQMNQVRDMCCGSTGMSTVFVKREIKKILK